MMFFCYYYQSFEFFGVFKASGNQKNYEQIIYDPHDGFLKFPLYGLFKEKKKLFKVQTLFCCVFWVCYI